MKKKIAIAFAGILLMLTASFAPIAQAQPVGSVIYVTMGGKFDGTMYIYAQTYLPNCRVPSGGMALPFPGPFVTRAPLLSPGHLLQNITFSPPIDVNNDTVPDIISISVQMTPIVHYIFVPPPLQKPGAWLRFTMVAPAAGGGVIFINPAMPGDVDCYTFNNDTGVYWDAPSQLAGQFAAASGGHFNMSDPNPAKWDFVPGLAARLPSGGADSIPGTRLWMDPLDGFGDGQPDPVGSSIIMLPFLLKGDVWNATLGMWLPYIAIPMPLVLTTGTAYDHVASLDPTPGDPPGESFIYSLNSTEQGTPWDAAFTKVTYVGAWSNLLYALNPDDDGDGVPDPDPAGWFYTMDAFWEFTEKKVRQDVVIGDINCDNLVDIFDCVIIGVSYGSEDEGIGLDGIPFTADDKYTADPNFDPRADLNGDGFIDIFDLTPVGITFGQRLDP